MRKKEEHSATHQVLLTLSRFPMNQLWRFIVDGKLQKEEGGWEQYDAREPGSVAAAIRGMTLALKHLNKPINVNLIRDLHVTCGTDVTFNKPLSLGDFNNGGVYEQLLPEVSTQQAIFEFLKKHPKHNIQGFILVSDEVGKTSKKIHGRPIIVTRAITLPLNHYTKQECQGCVDKLKQGDKFLSKEWRLTYYPPGSYSPEQAENLKSFMEKGCQDGYTEKSMVLHVHDVLTSYNSEVKATDDWNQHAESAALATQEFTRLHPFGDLVNRVFVNCLFFLMELKNGFVPPIFYDPNFFAFTHLPALLQRIGIGQRKTNVLVDRPNAEIFGISVPIDAEVPAELKEATNEFRAELGKALYRAGHEYIQKKQYGLALSLYSRAYRMFKDAESTSIKDHASHLYCLGVCYGKTGHADQLDTIIVEMKDLHEKCKEDPNSDLFSKASYVQGYLQKLAALRPTTLATETKTAYHH